MPLVDTITKEADVAFDGGRTNNLSDLTCSIGSIVASFLAAVLAAVRGAPGWLTAIIAAFPGLCASLQGVVDFRGRSAWYFVKYGKLRELEENLRWDPNLSEPEAARRFGAIVTEMENRWTEFVKTAGSAPASRAASVSGGSSVTAQGSESKDSRAG